MARSESSEEVLSSRELEVAGLAAQGFTTKEVAASLFVSVPTVKSHLREIFRKCGVRNRVGLAAWWFARVGEPGQGGQPAAEGATTGAVSLSGAKGARARNRGKLLAIAVAGAAAIAAVVSWQVYARPLALGAGNSPPPPPPLSATMGEEAGRSWKTADGGWATVSYDAHCRLPQARLPGEGWAGLSLFLGEQDITEAEATRGWVQQGVYDCDYGPFAVGASDGRAFSIPGVPSQCYSATRSVAEVYGPEGVDRYGWYDGLGWCDDPSVFAYLNAALADLGLEPDTGDPP